MSVSFYFFERKKNDQFSFEYFTEENSLFIQLCNAGFIEYSVWQVPGREITYDYYLRLLST